MNELTLTGDNIFLIATLQDYGRPYVSLLLDKDANGLYLLVRQNGRSNDSNRYIISPVSSDDIREYMNGSIRLGSLICSRGFADATIKNHRFIIEPKVSVNQINDIKKEGLFEADYCYDSLKVKVFLKKYAQGEYMPK